MASPIERLQERTNRPVERTRVLELREAEADEVLDALATETRRRTYRALFEDPATTSELAEELDTSIQNVQYHLERLREAGLVEPVDTVYSAKGNEMTVYGPASDPIVFVGDEERYPRVERSLASLVTGLALLGIASLLVQWAATGLVASDPTADGSVVPASPDAAATEPVGALAWLVFGALEPGMVFFVVGLVVAAAGIWLRRR